MPLDNSCVISLSVWSPSRIARISSVNTSEPVPTFINRIKSSVITTSEVNRTEYVPFDFSNETLASDTPPVDMNKAIAEKVESFILYFKVYTVDGLKFKFILSVILFPVGFVNVIPLTDTETSVATLQLT